MSKTLAKFQAQEKQELETIDKEFKEIISREKHCYDRKGETKNRCDCQVFYEKWLETKQRYQKLYHEVVKEK